MEPTAELGSEKPIDTWKDGIRDSMQRRLLKDKECLDRKLWREK
jgi:hypothetical protein